MKLTTPISSYLRHKKLYTPIQIRFSDIDIAGHINNAVYQSFFDLAKMDFLNTVFQNTIDWKKSGFVVAHIDIDYIQPIYLNEKIEVCTSLSKIGEKSFEIQQDIMAYTKDKAIVTKAKSHSVMVCFDYEEATSLKISEKQHHLLKIFLKDDK